MVYSALDGSKNLCNIIRLKKYRRTFRKKHPEYFDPHGLLVFCGPQGSGKTLSAVQYVQQLTWMYPLVKVVTNVQLNNLNPAVEVIEYKGLESLTSINNGYAGVIFFIDEIHLEFNSLESKNIPIEVMVEVSQQRKQRKHIIGTSQQFMRLAKPLREQVKNLVLCRCLFGCLQYNKLIDGETIREIDGHLKMDVRKKSMFFHTPALYESFDTYAKMKRYRKDWQGVSRQNIY